MLHQNWGHIFLRMWVLQKKKNERIIFYTGPFIKWINIAEYINMKYANILTTILGSYSAPVGGSPLQSDVVWVIVTTICSGFCRKATHRYGTKIQMADSTFNEPEIKIKFLIIYPVKKKNLSFFLIFYLVLRVFHFLLFWTWSYIKFVRWYIRIFFC